MTQQHAHRLIIAILLLCQSSICPAAEPPAPSDPNRYLNAVREFADNVLQYGRDTYGPKHTPLFVDGLSIHTYEPVKWIAPNGKRWVLSNLASQQNLFRTFDGLTRITGDPKYKQAAMDAIRYAFDNLRSPNGLLYWGVAYAYDADGDKPCSTAYNHSLRYNFPYYELMWEVTQDGLRDYIESFWAAHILDWSNLDMLRYASLDSQIVGKGWKHHYKGGPVFSVGKGDCSLIAGSPLFYAAAMLSRLSDNNAPLIWSERLVHRYVETRNANTGIASFGYLANNNILTHQFSDIINSHNISFPSLFPFQPKVLCDPKTVRPMWAFQIRGWICVLLLGELLGPEGEDFKRWTLEELTAWGKSAYRKRDNAFIPMFTDGTSLEGYVLKKDGYFGAKGTVYRAWHPGLVDLWGYALTYRLTGNEFMWEMSRNIVAGNSFGDIGAIGNNKPDLDTTTDCSDPYALLSFLELYRSTRKIEFLRMASRIADNILTYRFHKGFFVPSKNNIYTRFDALEHLSLLHLFAAIKSRSASVPWVWPDEAVFGWDYRQQDSVFDVEIIYTLTDSLEPPFSLNEAAATGNLAQVKLRISEGADVNFRERPMWTPLHRAVMKGHKDIVTFLLTKGANVNARNSWPGGTPLHYAAEKGYAEIARLLIDNGADINTESAIDDRATPLQYAAYADNKDIVELLLQKGATIANLHIASYMGDLEKAEGFINEGVDINAIDGHGYAPLHYAVQNNQKQAVELLLQKGANVNVTRWNTQGRETPLDIACDRSNKDIAQLIIDKGADINATDNKGNTLLHRAVQDDQQDIAELLIDKGANIDAKNNNGRTALSIAVQLNHKDIAELLINKGAHINATDNRGNTLLHRTAQNGLQEIAELLIDKGANIDAKNNGGQTPLDIAFSKDRRSIVELLVAKGAEVSSIHTAAYVGDLCKVKAFLEEGVDVNTKDRNMRGQTALHIAASEGHKQIVELLLESGARVNAGDNMNRTAAERAMNSKQFDIVELLISKGADVSPLHLAISMKDEIKARSLIASGAGVNKRTQYGTTPLHTAAHVGLNDIAQLLIEKGADINAQENWNWTPLNLAINSGNLDIVELLITKGANVNTESGSGRYPLSYAKGRGLTEIAELLRKHGAKE